MHSIDLSISVDCKVTASLVLALRISCYCVEKRGDARVAKKPTTAAAGNNQRLVCREHERRSAAAASAVRIVGHPCLASDDQQHLACLEADSAIDDAAQPYTRCRVTQQETSRLRKC